MGKGKKGRRTQDEDEWENDLEEIAKESGLDLHQTDQSDVIQPSVLKKKEKKKGKKNITSDDRENDLEEIAKESGLDLHQTDESDVIQPSVLKKKEKKKGKKNITSDDREELQELEPTVEKAPKNKLSFQALMIEGDSDDNDDSPDEDESIIPEKETVPKISKIDKTNQKENNKKNGENLVTEANEEDSTISRKSQSKKEKSKKKSKKGQDHEDEDIDSILAQLEITTKTQTESKKSKKKAKSERNEDEKRDTERTEDIDNEILEDKDHKESIVDAIDNLDDQSEKNITEETKGKDVEMTDVDDHNIEQGPTMKTDVDDHNIEQGPTMKTAAQKKAEKKEKDKKKKQKTKKVEATEDKKKDEGHLTEASVDQAKDDDFEASSAAVKEDNTKAEDSGDEDVEGKEKKKKKKKKKKGEEEEKKKGKRPGKALVKQMQEALEKAKAEEERLIAEEEAKLKAIEEAERIREEKSRLEKERKEKRKQKEKERKEIRKKEGTLLTPAQKEQKRRAELMLEAMKQQGILIPSKDAIEQRKKVQYVKKKKPDQVQNQATKDTTEIPTSEILPKEDDKEVKEEEDENLPNSWEAEAEVEDVKEWDAESEDESSMKTEDTEDMKAKAEPVDTSKVTSKAEKSEEISDEESEEEDESEEESEEEDEESTSEEDSESESEDEKLTAEKIKENARERIQKRRVEAEANRTTSKLRSPVICVLGHVDTGKTKILDKIRHTHVQDGEAGGITQQIGATMVPLDAIIEQTKMVKEFQKFELNLPGLLIIDTPGHESFSNLRSRGSSLCDMAILVVDIMHGLEPQTIESISLLRKKHTPFIVALNKVDRLFEWKRGAASQVEDTIKKQKKNTKLEFEERLSQVVREFAEQGLNAALAFKNPDEKIYISLCPTSAHSGDGMGDLIALICRLTQTRLAKKLAYSEEVESTIMEVKALPGLGTTIDAILVNGKLREGDTIVTGGIEGPIVTQIRALLTPQPLRELRIKSNYIQHKELEAAQGVKITGKDLDRAMAGAPLFVARQDDEIEIYKEEVEEIVSSSLKAIKVTERGVYVQSSTLGSLEALLEFLKSSKIPYAGVNIGPVHRKDVMKASVMLAHEPMYAVILAFDVKVEREAQEFADRESVKIFTADIIYHLFDRFTEYCADFKQKKKNQFKHLAVFPCKLRILPEHIFNSRGPIVVGVHVDAGTVRLGTPITVPSKEFCDVGFVTGIEANHKNMEKATSGQEICIKIECSPGEPPKMYGRHFTHEDILMSKVTRESIDCMKEYFRDDMQKSDWQLIIEMKKLFGII